MPPSTPQPSANSSTRRSQRVFLTLHVSVAGQRDNGQQFSEETATTVVNAHGALIHLQERVFPGQQLKIQNVSTKEECACRVIAVGDAHSGRIEVGIEFIEPNSCFWRVAFPPSDWSHKSAEAKRRNFGVTLGAKKEN